MGHAVRDDRIDLDELENSLARQREWIDRDRQGVIESLARIDADPASGAAALRGSVGDAPGLCRGYVTYFSRCYAAGVPVPELAADLCDAWRDDLLLSLRLQTLMAGADPNLRAVFQDRDIHRGAIDCALIATSLGRADVATTVLSHPSVAALPSRVLDALAVIQGVPRPVSENDTLSRAYEGWLKVGSATRGRRQVAFERYVRRWRADNEKVRRLIPPTSEFFTGEWVFEAVVLAQAYGLDDGPVRDVPEYPVDLADHAREAGLPRLGDDIRLPGPWKKPKPPRVIEPEVAREPVELSGTVSRDDLAALLTPVGGGPLGATTDHALLDAAVEAGTVLVIDWKGVVPEETGELLKSACRDLGIPVPGRVPWKATMTVPDGVQKFDEWLTVNGARLVTLDLDSDDLIVAPVLVADHESFADRASDTIRLRSVEQFVADHR
ncbi:DUF6630 family protein [Georgenia sp. Z1491]|uniref:DUF6630 family protein n=1 Tax=Georgenia sp. Z1491 TaxID=3416707 RepID=UPI003CF6A733